MRRHIAIMLASLGVLWAGCAAAQEQVRIGLAAANLFSAPLFAAEELGFFEEAGIDIQIDVMRGGAAAQEALSIGAVDLITFPASGVALAVSKGARQKVVATCDDSPYLWHMLVNADAPYQSVGDLAGHKIAITSKTATSDALAMWAAEKAGITYETVPVGAGGIAALKSGSVDAVVLNPSGLQLIADGSARSLMNFGTQMEPTLNTGWVASQQIIDERPEALRKTLQALYRGVRHMQENREWSLEFLARFTKEQDPKIVEMMYEGGTLAQSGDGAINPASATAALQQAAIMYDTDAIRALTPNDIVDTNFVPAKTN